jgi:TPP-dependent pyruvate/acetoin dehydrogenase alpha subunit
VERARRGEGPTLLVTECYRIEGHYAGEPEVYRNREEVNEQRKNDPIPSFAHYLIEQGFASKAEIEGINAAIQQEMLDSIEYAKASPMPDPSTATDYIYA